MNRDDLFDPLPKHIAEAIEREQAEEKAEYEREEPWVALAYAMLALGIIGTAITAAAVLVLR